MSDPTKHLLACLTLGGCFGVGLPALYYGNWVVFLVCFVVSLLAAVGVGKYARG